MKLLAVLWDYDGTLMNSIYKNFLVTREVLLHVKPEFEKIGWPYHISTFELYKEIFYQTLNWQEIYTKFFNLTKEETKFAGGFWSQFQMKNKTPVDMFDGIDDVIRDLSFVPHGICSLNCSLNISNMLKTHNVDHFFKSIVGYTSLSFARQKPFPDAFLCCVNEMNIEGEGTIFYIGDHQEDIRFAYNAEIALKEQGRNINVRSIAACYAGANSETWKISPNYNAYSVGDIVKYIKLSDVNI